MCNQTLALLKSLFHDYVLFSFYLSLSQNLLSWTTQQLWQKKKRPVLPFLMQVIRICFCCALLEVLLKEESLCRALFM